MNCQKTREAIDAGISKALLSSHLGDCAACESYSNELSSLLSLLREQPRVEAPADFEFRLKARIARAQADQATASALPAWATKLWSGSFSWVQATAATAAVALVVSVSTYQIYQNNQVAPAATPEAPFVALHQGQTAVDSPSTAVNSSLTVAPSVAREAVRPARLAASVAQSPVMEAATPGVDPAAAGNSMNIFNGEQGRMISTSSQMMLIGAEGSTGAGASGTRGLGYVPSI
ncbi:MAG: hypothetical protein ACK5RR_11130 [Acidobacteriota bacterium]